MLVGTWKAGFGDFTDTLVFRDDGQYQQTIHFGNQGPFGEGEWKSWDVTFGASGIPHVHLQGMRMCIAYQAQDCGIPGSGSTSWLDFCDDKVVEMSGEGILLAIGSPPGFSPPRGGFDLVPLVHDPDSGGYSYSKQ